MTDWFILIPAGLGIGVLGTFVGIGGGIFMMPILLLLYNFSPAIAAGTSLAAIFVNALSGTIAYARQKRVDFKLGSKFAVATLPGAVIGSYVVGYFAQPLYILLFAVIMIIIAAELLVQGQGQKTKSQKQEAQYKKSRVYTGIGFSFLAGFLASIFGLGGGIIHVPFMILFLGFAVHNATATSYFILTITSFAGAAAAAGLGNVDFIAAAELGLGLAVGAHIGAILSAKAKSTLIVQILVIIIIVVALRLIAKALLIF